MFSAEDSFIFCLQRETFVFLSSRRKLSFFSDKECLLVLLKGRQLFLSVVNRWLAFIKKSVLLCFQKKKKALFVSSREELSFVVWEIIISREILYGSFSKRNGLLLLKTFSSVSKRVKLSFPSLWGTLPFLSKRR